MDFSQVGKAIESQFVGSGAQIIRWVGYFVYAVIIMAIMYGIYLYIQYKYKAEIYIRRSSGTDDYSIGKIVTKKMRVINKNGIKMWQFFLSRKSIPPIDDADILPGNRLKLFQVNTETYMPVKFKVGNPEAILFPTIPPDIKFWQSLEIQQAEREYQDTKGKYMPMVMVMGTILLCMIFAGIMIYLIVKSGSAQAGQISSAIKGLNPQNIAQSIGPN